MIKNYLKISNFRDDFNIFQINLSFWNLPTEYLLFAVIPIALTGGTSCLAMAMYSYISDITAVKSRTARIAFFDTFIILGSTCGLILSNVTKTTIGFDGAYIVIFILLIFPIIYILVQIKETRGQDAYYDQSNELIPKPNAKLRDLFNCENIRQTFKTTFEPRPNYGRAKVVLIMICICLMVFGFGKYYSCFIVFYTD